MPTYDSTQFDPPAPLARVTLRTLSNGNIVPDVPMLIDSGADLTLIPGRFIEVLKLEVDQSESYELEGFDGNRSMAESVQLELVFLRRSFRGRFLLVNSQSGILGRNVLNHFAILLDGPGLSWELTDAVK
ncbi:MAG: retropepsin-like aspartic protease [bacterium]